jgi:apolipoprotein N-acyltransferase
MRGVEWTQPYSKPITVAVVQGAIPQDEKWIADNLQSTLDRYEQLTRQAHGAKLIVWPESAIPDLANNHIEYYRDVYAEASARGSSLIMGTLRQETIRRRVKSSSTIRCWQWIGPRRASRGTTNIISCPS